MQDSVYNGVFGALTQQNRLNIISNNLSNVNTAGFKQNKLAFEDSFNHYAHDLADPNPALKGGVRWPESDEMTQPRISESSIDFSQGGMRKTGNSLDLAIQGEGFFKVQTPDGEFFTRNGAFSLNSQGYLVNTSGYRLMGEGGPIQIDSGGKIDVNATGGITVNENMVDQISVRTVSDLDALEKRGENLLQLKEDAEAREVPAQNARVKQGFLEESNVQIVDEMVRMIETMRTFQACQKVMTSSNESDSQLIDKVGNP